MCYNVAMETKQTIQIKVYRDTKYSAIETYLPIVKANIVTFAKKIDYTFVNGHWPNNSGIS